MTGPIEEEIYLFKDPKDNYQMNKSNAVRRETKVPNILPYIKSNKFCSEVG